MKLWVTLLLSLSAFLLLPVPAQPQKVGDLAEGMRVRVEAPRIRATEGTFQSATADSVKMISDGVHLVFSRSDSLAVFQSAGVNRSRSALVVGTISGILGALAGGAIGGMSFKPCESKGVYDCGYVPNSKSGATGFGAAVFGVSSFLVGGIVGALKAGDTWVRLQR